MDKPHVLMIGPGRDVMGGISTVVNNYYECGLDKSVDLRYISTMEDGGKLKKLIVAIKAYFLFCRLLDGYDIVHVHMAAHASFDRKAIFIKRAYKAGKKIIIHQHSGDFDEYYCNIVNTLKRNKIKNIFSMADRIIVLSEEWQSFFAEHICTSNKIKIIPNGVILPDYIKTDYSDFNVLFLGRLSKSKGIYDLLESARNVVKEIPEVQFFLGGDGELEKCRNIVESYGLSNNFHFLGWIDKSEKVSYLKKCSIFILPSYYEGLPMSLLEAMSFGLATISSNVGGIPQIVENDANGFLIEPGNSMEITNLLIELIRNPELKKSVGYSAENTIASKFNIVRNIYNLCDLYKQLG